MMMVVITMMVMVVVVVMEEDVEGEGPICFIFLCLRVFIYKMVKIIASTSRAGVKMKREYLYRLGLYLANTPKLVALLSLLLLHTTHGSKTMRNESLNGSGRGDLMPKGSSSSSKKLSEE